MTRARDAAALTAAFLAGFVARRPAAPAAPAAPAPETVEVVGPGATRIVRVPADCPSERDTLALENVVLRGQLSALGGAPIPWPEDVAGPFREAALAAWLAGVEEDLAAERLALDCAEFPCVAVYRLDEGQPTSSAVVDAIRQGFVDRSGDLGRPTVRVTGGPDGSYAAVSFGPADDDLRARLEVRMEELIEAER